MTRTSRSPKRYRESSRDYPSKRRKYENAYSKHRYRDYRDRDYERDRDYRDRDYERRYKRRSSSRERRYRKEYDSRKQDKREKKENAQKNDLQKIDNKTDQLVKEKNDKKEEQQIPKQEPKVDHEETDEEYKKRIEQQLAELEEDEETKLARIREERRKRLEAIKKKKQEEQQQQEQQQPEIKQEPKEPKKETNENAPKPQETKPQPETQKKQPAPIFDMFSDSPITPQDLTLHSTTNNTAMDSTLQMSLADNWDDAEMYYRYRIGEIMDDRYRVVGTFGKGAFGEVLKAYDIKNNNEVVAIKVLRNNEVMKKAGLREVEYLRKLAETDPEHRYYCVRMQKKFMHRNHLCIVFDSEELNLREVIKKFGTENGKLVGINIDGVRLYAKQLFIALKHLKNSKILHTDIKPDNILVNAKNTAVKLCDLGSAMHISEIVKTPQLGSRYYCAPEIPLGVDYDYGIDMWSIACTLYELFTGKILFQSENNNDHLRLIMEVKGPFPAKVLKRALFREEHFDDDFNFLLREYDHITGKEYVRKYNVQKRKSIKQMLMDTVEDESKETREKVLLLADLLERALALDPVKRLTVEEAMLHPFVYTPPPNKK